MRGRRGAQRSDNDAQLEHNGDNHLNPLYWRELRPRHHLVWKASESATWLRLVPGPQPRIGLRAAWPFLRSVERHLEPAPGGRGGGFEDVTLNMRHHLVVFEVDIEFVDTWTVKGGGIGDSPQAPERRRSPLRHPHDGGFPLEPRGRLWASGWASGARTGLTGDNFVHAARQPRRRWPTRKSAAPALSSPAAAARA